MQIEPMARIHAAGVILFAAAAATLVLVGVRSSLADEPAPQWTPPPTDPRNIEGVWLPGGYANGAGAVKAGGPAASTAGGAPPPEIGGLTAPQTPPDQAGRGDGRSAPGPPPGAGQEQVVGSTLECTPVQRLGGAGGGMSNLWIQGPNEIVMISEEDMDIRKIYLGGAHPANLKPQPNGHSVGHWEGNTLVVDSIGFADANGHDIGQHVVERIRKDGNALIDEATITQNGTTRKQLLRSSWRSDLHVSENVCEENYDRFEFENGHLVDKTQ